MKSILLVEDEDLLREIITESLRMCNVGCVVHAVAGGQRAVELLGSQKFDLLITDLCLPDIDGLALLSWMRERRLNIPSIVITGRQTAGLESLVRSLGAVVFFEKPFDLNVLLVTVERFLLAAADNTENRIQGFTLPSFLQLMEMDGKTSLVRVFAPDNREGQLRFLNGKLVSALTHERTGDEAAVEILNWPDPEIRLSSIVEPLVPNVHTNLTGLLLRSCHERDELLNLDNAQPSPIAAFVVESRPQVIVREKPD